MPRVSIVIPVYNPGKFLRPALESVQNQTYTDWEIIVIDDGSTEDIASICQNVPGLRYSKQAHSGQSIARNAGVIQSCGELIAFLDHDDVWHPTKLQQQVEAMDKDPDIALCYTNYEVIDHNGMALRTSVRAADFLHQDLTVFAAGSESFLAISELGIPTCTVAMIRRNAVGVTGLFDPLLSCCEDYDLWFRLCIHFKSVYLPSIEASYRQHARQHTRVLLSTSNDEQVWDKYLRIANATKNPALAQASHRMRKLARRNFAALAYDQARLNFRTRNWSGAIKYLSKSGRLDPHSTFYNSTLWAFNKLKPQACLREHKCLPHRSITKARK